MSETSYTPGPWVRDEEVGRGLGIVEITTSERINSHFVPIVQVDTEWYEPLAAEQRANALLIIAAPDLFEALVMIVNGLDWSLLLESDDLPDRKQAHAALLQAAESAIAKAKGEQP